METRDQYHDLRVAREQSLTLDAAARRDGSAKSPKRWRPPRAAQNYRFPLVFADLDASRALQDRRRAARSALVRASSRDGTEADDAIMTSSPLTTRVTPNIIKKTNGRSIFYIAPNTAP
jgi:hypothetical protein